MGNRTHIIILSIRRHGRGHETLVTEPSLIFNRELNYINTENKHMLLKQFYPPIQSF